SSTVRSNRRIGLQLEPLLATFVRHLFHRIDPRIHRYDGQERLESRPPWSDSYVSTSAATHDRAQYSARDFPSDSAADGSDHRFCERRGQAVSAGTGLSKDSTHQSP